MLDIAPRLRYFLLISFLFSSQIQSLLFDPILAAFFLGSEVNTKGPPALGMNNVGIFKSFTMLSIISNVPPYFLAIQFPLLDYFGVNSNSFGWVKIKDLYQIMTNPKM